VARTITYTMGREMLYRCPTPLPVDLDAELRRLASLWAEHPVRPRIDSKVATHWDALIAAWAEDDALPLLIRKWKNEEAGKESGGEGRGEVIIHDSGRELVPADNSAASWSYLSAFCGELPSLSDIQKALKEDRIPVAMVTNRKTADRCTLQVQSYAAKS
jgi:hypothetical protein